MAIYLIIQIQAAFFVKNISKDANFVHLIQLVMTACKDIIYQTMHVSIAKRISLPACIVLIQLTVQYAHKVTILQVEFAFLAIQYLLAPFVLILRIVLAVKMATILIV